MGIRRQHRDENLLGTRVERLPIQITSDQSMAMELETSMFRQMVITNKKRVQEVSPSAGSNAVRSTRMADVTFDAILAFTGQKRKTNIAVENLGRLERTEGQSAR